MLTEVKGEKLENFYLWVGINYPPGRNRDQIINAWKLVVKYQGFDFRRDNTPVLDHLVMTAQFMWNWGFRSTYIQGALLHDIVEDCRDVNLAFIGREFGPTVAKMVSFMSRNKLSGYPDYQTKVNKWLEKYPFYIFLRLADQRHNLLNQEGYRTAESRLRNFMEILDNIFQAERIIQRHKRLQNNQILKKDLSELKNIVLKHLASGPLKRVEQL